MLSKEQNLTGDKSPSAICSGKTTETSYGSNSFAVAPAVRQTAKRFVDVRINRVAVYLEDAGWSSPVARQAHNLKAAGSNPAPATKIPIDDKSTK